VILFSVMSREKHLFESLFLFILLVVFRGLEGIAMFLPARFWAVPAGFLAAILWRLFPSYRRRALKNLARVGFTQKEAFALGKRSYRSNMLVLVESLAMKRLLSRRGVRVETRATPAAEEVIAKIRSGEIPVAFGLSGHVGVWEFLGAEMARLCAPTKVAVSVHLGKNPAVASLLLRLRDGTGLESVAKEKIVRHILSMARRKEPRLYLFLCDQHYKGGPWVPFFGKRACTVPVPASLIMKYGNAPVLLGSCLRRKPGDYLIEITTLERPAAAGDKKEAELEIMRAVNAYLEKTIRKAPEQWIWGHKRWKLCCGPEARLKGIAGNASPLHEAASKALQ